MEIILLTTKGCEGCNIMRNILQEAIKTESNIEYNEFEFPNIHDVSVYIGNVTDFPATFIKNNNIVKLIIGTRPIPIIKKIIKELK